MEPAPGTNDQEKNCYDWRSVLANRRQIVESEVLQAQTIFGFGLNLALIISVLSSVHFYAGSEV